jgi:hypothetical protein
MARLLPILIWLVTGTTIPPLIALAPTLAHPINVATAGSLAAMIHLDPKAAPSAGQPSQIWFMLTRRNDEQVSPADCRCRVSIFNSQGQTVIKDLPLSTLAIAGQETDHQAMQTTITFPKPGAYQVVLTGQASTNRPSPFEFAFPVTVRP